MREAEFRTMYEAEGRHWWYVSLHDLVLAYIPGKKPDQRILDAGCGTGRLLELLQSRGTAEGCDASDIALQYCGMRGVAAFKADLNCGPGPARYDVITSIDVLYHRNIKDDARVLQSLYSALKPGGKLILQVPAYEWLRSSHDDAVHTGTRYTVTEVKQMMKACGFFIEKATYRVTLLFAPIALVRLFRNLGDRRRRADDAASDVMEHLPFVNGLLLAIMRAENLFLRFSSFPFGTSVFVVARKPESPRR